MPFFLRLKPVSCPQLSAKDTLNSNPMVSYPSAFAVGVYSRESACALTAEVLSKQESGSKILLVVEWPICPTGLVPKCAGQTSFKQLIQGTCLNLILLQKMSVAGPEDIKVWDCERGRVTQ